MRRLGAIALSTFVILAAAMGGRGQTLDISSGGTPTITGALNGSVTGSSSVTTDLAFSVNFGEISPVNTNDLIVVKIPIAVRSTQPYRVSVTVAGISNPAAQAFRYSDIGFGVGNMRRLGAQGRVCNRSPHIVYPPFDTDPSLAVTLDPAGRATYSATLSDVGLSAVILSGPRLSGNSNPNRQGNDGWVFDVTFAVTPQFYASGNSSATLIFSISPGPNVPC